MIYSKGFFTGHIVHKPKKQTNTSIHVNGFVYSVLRFVLDIVECMYSELAAHISEASQWYVFPW